MRGAPVIRSGWICLLLFAALSVQAVEVQEIKWGFDGQVVANRFNPVTLLVANPLDEPFDGDINLYKTRGLGERVGAIYRVPCYLSPGTSRWLQFYVYIDNEYDQWRAESGRRPDDHYDAPAPKWGAPAQVVLSDSELILNGSGAFKQFPDELFPPTATAASGLDSVLLDHAPRWEASQRQAFLNWLRGGGKVHLLMDADGHYPVFSDELTVLNSPVDRVRIGAGMVVRHAVNVRNIHKGDIEQGQVPVRVKANDQNNYLQNNDAFFRVLAQLERRRYSWGWIYLMAMAYVALVGPGQILAGRKLPDYRLRIVLSAGDGRGLRLAV